MTCKNCNIKPVWKFTNQTKLCRACFIDYVERKVFAAIRKYSMMPSDRVFRIKKESSLNYRVLKAILEKKFTVKPGKVFVSDNLSLVAEKVFENIIRGEFNGSHPKDSVSRPLYFVSDAEIELYAKLRQIKGNKREKDKRVRELFARFFKNPDLEHNIVNAFLQMK